MNLINLFQKISLPMKVKLSCNLSFLSLLLLMILQSSLIYGQNAVTIYEKTNFGGRSKGLAEAEYPGLDKLETGFNWVDKTYSIKVSKGYKVELYNNWGFIVEGPKPIGPFMLYAGDYPNLWTWSGIVTSMKVIKIDPEIPVVTFFCDPPASPNKPKQCLGPGIYNYGTEGNLYNDAFNWISVPKGVSVTVYDNWNGTSTRTPKTFRAGEKQDLSVYGFAGNITSIEILRDSFKLVNATYILKNKENLGQKTIGNSITCDNISGIAQKGCAGDLTRTYQKETSFAWSTSAEATIGVSLMVGASGGVPGVGEVNTELTVSSSLSVGFGTNKEEKKSDGISIGTSADCVAPPGYSIGCLMIGKAVKTVYDVTYYYESMKDATVKYQATGVITVDEMTDTECKTNIIVKPRFVGDEKKRIDACTGNMSYVLSTSNEVFRLKNGEWENVGSGFSDIACVNNNLIATAESGGLKRFLLAPDKWADYGTSSSGVTGSKQTAPVVIYYDDNYGGGSKELSVGSYAGNKDFENDQISSIKVKNGYKVTLYKNGPNADPKLVLTADKPSLSGVTFDNETSNILVEDVAPVVIYYDENYSGGSKELSVGSYAGIKDFENDQISSIKVKNGYKVTLYKNGPNADPKLVLTADKPSLSGVSFNNETSNILIEKVK